jgi:hypothetical protein
LRNIAKPLPRLHLAILTLCRGMVRPLLKLLPNREQFVMVKILLSAVALGSSIMSLPSHAVNTASGVSTHSESGSLVMFGVSLLVVSLLTRRLPRRSDPSERRA